MRAERSHRWASFGAWCTLAALAGTSCASPPPATAGRARRRVPRAAPAAPPIDERICRHFYDTVCRGVAGEARTYLLGSDARLRAMMRATDRDLLSARPALGAFVRSCNVAARVTPLALFDPAPLARLKTVDDVGRAVAAMTTTGARPLFAVHRAGDGAFRVDRSPERFVPVLRPASVSLRGGVGGALTSVEASLRAPDDGIGAPRTIDELESVAPRVPWAVLLGAPLTTPVRIEITDSEISTLKDAFGALSIDDWRRYLAVMSTPADVVLGTAAGTAERRSECWALALDAMPDEVFEYGRSSVPPGVVARTATLAVEIGAAARARITAESALDGASALDRLDRLRWWLPSTSYVTRPYPRAARAASSSFGGVLAGSSMHWAEVCRDDDAPWSTCNGGPQSERLYAWADVRAGTVSLAPWMLADDVGDGGALYGTLGYVLGHEVGHLFSLAFLSDSSERQCLAEKATFALQRSVPAAAVDQLQADLVGLRLALDALRAKPGTTPADVRALFTAYARLWCAPDPTIDEMSASERIPFLQNVHLTLNEVPAFAESFGCPRPREPICAAR